jgi:CheY-specific phosphatase CheX
MSSKSELLLDNFCNAVGDLVECYSGVVPEISQDVASSEAHDFTAIIGMCDEALSASISLTTNTETIRTLSRVPLANLADWLGELSNQLAGRFKNKLSIYGLQPRLSTPTTVSGQMLLLGALAGEVYVLSVQWPDGRIEAQLSLQIEDSLELLEDHALASAEEGSLDLF